ncbi:ribonuclease H-like domain-containing protein [Tanacetum coccineum]
MQRWKTPGLGDSKPFDTLADLEDGGEVMFIEIIKDDDEPQNESPNKGEGTTTEGPTVEYFDTFLTRDELTYHKYLTCVSIPLIFLQNPIITEGCPSNLKIPCNIRHVHVKKAYIDLIMTRMMYNWIMRRKLNPRENANGGISNFTGRIKGMHVFIGNFTYVVDFMIFKDISSIIHHRLSQVVLGRPFIEISNMTHDLPKGVVRFANENDEVAYKMPPLDRTMQLVVGPRKGTHKIGIVKPIDRLSLDAFSISHIPKNPSHALKDPHWRNAMYDEYNALVKNGTWLLVPRPVSVNMVRSMWLFKHKFHVDGTLSHYKARLVANGSSQQLGVDFYETFSPVVKPATIRTVLSFVVSRQWPIHQLDVKNAFLNGDLSETVYMHQPLVMPYGLASSLVLLQQIIDSLHNEFDMTDLGALNYFLGISATRTPTGLFLSQKKYALQLLERAHMVNCNPSRTPVGIESKLGLEGAALCCTQTYLAIRSGTVDFSLRLYVSATTSLVGYIDADWAGCPSTRRSTSGYCVFLGDNLLLWLAKRQHTLSRSSAEAEYHDVANVIAETTWLHNLLHELHSPLSTATLVYCDNVSVVYMSANPVQHQRTKHTEIDIYFVRDMVTAGQVRVFHVPSRYQYADIFTKGLPSALFEDF